MEFFYSKSSGVNSCQLEVKFLRYCLFYFFIRKMLGYQIGKKGISSAFNYKAILNS